MGAPLGQGAVLLLLCKGERLHRSAAWLGGEGLLCWLRGHERALTYHSEQRERVWESPCTENPPITQDTQITNGKTWPGGSGDEEPETNSSVGTCQDPWSGEHGPGPGNLVPHGRLTLSSPPLGSAQCTRTDGYTHPQGCWSLMPCLAVGWQEPNCAHHLLPSLPRHAPQASLN